MITVFFILFAIVAVVSAIFMIVHKNPVYSALFLIVTFFSIAGFYFLLGAQFIAIVQIIVYAGAIMVLFLFVMMLLNLRQETRIPIGRPFQVIFGSIIAVLLLIQVFLITKAGLQLGQVGEYSQQKIDSIGSVEVIGSQLFTNFLFPFEAASVLLLVGIVGAIILGRKKLPKDL
jgi:NADH-quinone oxidoreductase subunit J